MQSILVAFHLDSPDSLKRAIAAALGGIVVLGINPFLSAKGLPAVSDAALETFAGVVAAFILQSGANAAAQKLADARAAGVAAAAALTPEQAAAKVAEAAKEVAP